MFARIAAVIVLATSAVLVAAAPTGVDHTPTVTVRDVSGSDAAPSVTTTGPISSLLGGITSHLPPPLDGVSGALGGITGTLDGVAGGLLGGLTGGKGLPGGL